MKSIPFLLGSCLFLAAFACSRDDTAPPAPREALLADAGFDTAPVPVNRVSPKYPTDSLQHRKSGRTDVQVTIGVSGRVDEARVIASSGDNDLDEAARAAALLWTFEPALKQGKPVTVQVVIPFQFKLH